jgi:hypothetical protein
MILYGAGIVLIGTFAWAALAAADPAHIAAADLVAAVAPSGVIDNSAFVPGPRAQTAHEPFSGRLRLAEAAMLTSPADLHAHDVLGKDAQYFPAVDLAFVTVGGDLVPVTQEVIRSGSTGRGRSYWDVLVQAGQVWSETGDGGWSRAAFPFALVHSLEGETHNGLATFLYRNGKVSAVHFQVVQQTTPGHIETYFTAVGVTAASYAPGGRTDRASVARRYLASLRDAVPVHDWAELERQVGAARLTAFADGLDPGEIVLTGLD